MAEKSRIKTLSTRWLLPFKVAVFAVYTLLFGTLTFMFVSKEGPVGMVGGVVFYGYLFYRLFRMSSKIEHVEFDDEFLYVIRRKNDILIPLENIRSVEIKTLGGVYRVDLHFEDVMGSYFYFKPSLWYPLNHRKKDALVDVLRHRIDSAKRSGQ
jgi:hypothetical protein